MENLNIKINLGLVLKGDVLELQRFLSELQQEGRYNFDVIYKVQSTNRLYIKEDFNNQRGGRHE